MAESGTRRGVIHISVYDSTVLEVDMERTVSAVMDENPIAAYAVSAIRWDQNITDGQRTVSVNIYYNHDRTEIAWFPICKKPGR